MLYLQDTSFIIGVHTRSLKSFKIWTPAFERFPSEMHCMLSFTSCIHLGMFISPFEESLILRAVDPFFVVVFFARRYISMHAQIVSMPKRMTPSLSLALYLSLADIRQHLPKEHGMLFSKT